MICCCREVGKTQAGGNRGLMNNATTAGNSFLPLDISFAGSCRTSSGILSHWPSERQRSISVSSRDPDFLAVMFRD